MQQTRDVANRQKLSDIKNDREGDVVFEVVSLRTSLCELDKYILSPNRPPRVRSTF